jgi:hypothetical protein
VCNAALFAAPDLLFSVELGLLIVSVRLQARAAAWANRDAWAKGQRDASFSLLIRKTKIGAEIISMIRKTVAALSLTGALMGISSQSFAAPFGSTMANYAAAIRKIESTGRYHVTANAGRGRTALGAYQILDSNLASWSRAALGRAVGRAEFLRSPHLQDRIFHHRFGHFVKKYGAHGAARAWLGGEGAARGGGGRADRFGSTPASYAAKFQRALGS